MADIDDFEPLCQDISISLQGIKDKLNDMKSSGSDENSKVRKDIMKALAEADKSMNRFQDDLSTVSDSDDKKNLQRRYNKFQKLLDDYRREFQNLKEGKVAVQDDDVDRPKQRSNQYNNDSDTQRQAQVKYERGMNDKLDEAVDMSKETTKILQETDAKAEETVAIATETAARLKRQTEKMQEIQKHLDDIGGNTQRARKELAAFMRGLACDKCILIVVILIIILAALFIILRIVKPDLFSVDFAKSLIDKAKNLGGNSTATTHLTNSAQQPLSFRQP